MILENVKIAKATVKTIVADAVNAVEDTKLPVEVVEMVVGKMTWKVTAIKPDNTKDGAVEASFNQIENS